MRINLSIPVKSPGAIITRRGGATVERATRCTRCVAPGQPSPAAPSRARQHGPSWGPRGAQLRVGCAPPASRIGRRSRPRRPCLRVAFPQTASRRPRQVPRLRRRRRSHGGPGHLGALSSTALPSDEIELSPATPPAVPDGVPPPAPAGCPSTAATALGAAMAPAAPATPGPTGRRPAVSVRPSVPPGMRLRATPMAGRGGSRPARRAPLRRPAPGPKRGRPRRPAQPRTSPRPPTGGLRARRRSVHRYWGRRPLRFCR